MGTWTLFLARQIVSNYLVVRYYLVVNHLRTIIVLLTLSGQLLAVGGWPRLNECCIVNFYHSETEYFDRLSGSWKTVANYPYDRYQTKILTPKTNDVGPN